MYFHAWAALVLLAGLAAGPAVSGAASSPAWVDTADVGLRDDLAWLVDRGHVSLALTTWPLPRGTIEWALDGLESRPLGAADADALRRVRAALARHDPGTSLGAAVNSARHPSIGADGAARARAETSLQLRGEAADDAGVAWRLRVRLQKERLAREPSPVGLEGSYLAARAGHHVIGLGAVDRAWGPGRGHLILGDAAPPVPALIVHRSDDTPLLPGPDWFGRWSYEFSIGRPSHYTPRGPSTIGMRFVWRPLAGVEFGASRYLYWGGAGRPRSVESLARALVADSNVDDPSRDGPDPGNEIAGIDLRVAQRIGDAVWVAYGQLAGEDEAQGAPSKSMALLGLQLKHADAVHRYQWSAEAIDTRLGHYFNLRRREPLTAYEHSVYVDGHYHEGLPVGAWIGGGGVVGQFGLAWAPIDDPMAARHDLRVWGASVSRAGSTTLNDAYGTRGRVFGALWQMTGRAAALRWQIGLSLQGDPAGQRRRAGLQVAIELPIEAGR